jgi:hypothetical protein
MIGDAGDDVAQVTLGIEPVQLRGLCRPPNYAERLWKAAAASAHLCAVERTSLEWHSA